MPFHAPKHAFYAIYTRGQGAKQQLITIRHGFSFAAFFLTILWALYHRLWQPFALGLIAYSALVAFEMHQTISVDSNNILNIIILFYFGFEATTWREKRLQKDGYHLEDILYAANETAAKIKAFERQST